MAKARIFQPAKTAMQSGTAKTKGWVLEFVPQKPYFVENLMGWTGMSETQTEVRIPFASKEDALAYAEKHKLDFEVYEPHLRKTRRRAYADNFAFKKMTG